MVRHYIMMTLLLLGCMACQNGNTNEASTSTSETSTPTETAPANMNEQLLFVGTYTRKEGHVDGKAKGIAIMSVADNGYLEKEATIEGIINPSFVFVSKDGKYLYAVSETGPADGPSSMVYAYELGADNGTAKLLNQQATNGLAACYVSGDQSGRYLFVANYGGGISMLPIQADGSLGEASFKAQFDGKGPTSRQEASHPHSVFLSPDEKYAYVCDLGTDKIMIYQVDYDNGQLIPAQTPFALLEPGSGPRHLAFHPSQPYVFVLNELNSSIQVFSYNHYTGGLQTVGESYSTLPEDFSGFNLGADIHLSPDGRVLYSSNRGHNSIAIFGVDLQQGMLNPLGHEDTRGDFPRNFNIDPNGRYLYVANQNSDNIVQFMIDPALGRLEFAQEYEVLTPVCLTFGQ